MSGNLIPTNSFTSEYPPPNGLIDSYQFHSFLVADFFLCQFAKIKNIQFLNLFLLIFIGTCIVHVKCQRPHITHAVGEGYKKNHQLKLNFTTLW